MDEQERRHILPYFRNERDVKQLNAKRLELAKDKAVAEAWKRVANSKDGRLVLSDLFNFCGPLRTTFTGNAHGNMLEGMRNVALFAIARIYKEEQDVIDMLKHLDEIEKAIQD